jgi:hypothetical protein
MPPQRSAEGVLSLPGWYPMGRRAGPPRTRTLLVGLAFSWAVAGYLFLVARQDTINQERLNLAPICSASEMFTPAECRGTVDGTVVALSHSGATIQTDGRQLTMNLAFVGDVPATPLPVQVTLYRGRPVRLDGSLTIDAADSFVADARDESMDGWILAVAGPLGVVLLSLPRIVERLGTGPGGIQPR